MAMTKELQDIKNDWVRANKYELRKCFDVYLKDVYGSSEIISRPLKDDCVVYNDFLNLIFIDTIHYKNYLQKQKARRENGNNK